MKPRVDLDDLARQLESAVADWSKVAEVGPFMWHDRTADDQRRVTLERRDTRGAELHASQTDGLRH